MKKIFILSLALYVFSFFIFLTSTSFALTALGFTLLCVFSYNHTKLFENHGSQGLAFLTEMMPFFGKGACVAVLIIAGFMVLIPHSSWEASAGYSLPAISLANKTLFLVYMLWVSIGFYYLCCLLAWFTSWNYKRRKLKNRVLRII